MSFIATRLRRSHPKTPFAPEDKPDSSQNPDPHERNPNPSTGKTAKSGRTQRSRVFSRLILKSLTNSTAGEIGRRLRRPLAKDAASSETEMERSLNIARGGGIYELLQGTKGDGVYDCHSDKGREAGGFQWIIVYGHDGHYIL
ncbi:uncharacterized protein LOC110425616 [Herrania umbratica]|uniref:Uncharacterized protein LOC110425616 n=1 Tax=Herrania umbratica TaxID=108875 RepID=A0A6J1BCY1_9ROSI|nr:uncharacterized protein LOC110425616 [Herrania umbratica]